jgi:hypothetical protein
MGTQIVHKRDKDHDGVWDDEDDQLVEHVEVPRGRCQLQVKRKPEKELATLVWLRLFASIFTGGQGSGCIALGDHL